MFGLGIESSGHGTQGCESLGRSATRGTWVWAVAVFEPVARLRLAQGKADPG